MFLFELFLAFIAISYAHSSPPKIPFQQLLDTCAKPENSNSTQCQGFFTTYPWENEDIELVFREVVLSTTRAHRSSDLNSLDERLIRLIENPNFDLASLGKNSFLFAVFYKKQQLAIAIWPQLEKYKNTSDDFYFEEPKFNYTDLQLLECFKTLDLILKSNMLQLLKKMVMDQPNCLHPYDHTMEQALSTANDSSMREFLVDHGLEIIPRHFQSRNLPPEGLEWALVNYRHSNVLIKNSITNGSDVVAIGIWEFLSQKNYSDLLFQMCNDTIFDVVKSNKVELLKTMLRDCPDCIHLNGNTLMGTAIKEDQGSFLMIRLLNLYGIEIPVSHLNIVNAFRNTGRFERALLEHQPTMPREEWPDNIIIEYFMTAVDKNNREVCDKILAQNIPEMANILPECLEMISTSVLSR